MEDEKNLLGLFKDQKAENPKEDFINKLGVDLTMTILNAVVNSSYHILDVVVMMDEAMDRIIDHVLPK